jgi:hypothetical protein
MSRINEIKPCFIEYIPESIEEGVLYISEEFNVSIHLCACGCKEKTVMPIDHVINGVDHGWQMVNENNLISFTPSIGNFNPPPYHAHYFITRNKIIWA